MCLLTQRAVSPQKRFSKKQRRICPSAQSTAGKAAAQKGRCRRRRQRGMLQPHALARALLPAPPALHAPALPMPTSGCTQLLMASQDSIHDAQKCVGKPRQYFMSRCSYPRLPMLFSQHRRTTRTSAAGSCKWISNAFEEPAKMRMRDQ